MTTTQQTALKPLELSDVTNQQQTPGLQPIAQPTTTQLSPAPNATPISVPNQFADEARKIGLSEFEATRKIMGRDIEEQAGALNRELFGRNVGVQAGLGTKAVQDVLTERSRELEPVAQQIAERTASQSLGYQQENVNKLLELVSSGQLEMTPEVQAQLQQAGLPIGKLKTTTETNLQSMYGSKEDGTAFKSEQEAMQFWNDKNFNSDLIKQYGLNENGTPFASEQEALENWQDRGFDTALIQKYGLRDDGTPFASESEAKLVAERRYVQDQLNTKYGQKEIGTDADGDPIYRDFGSEQEAQSYWSQKKLTNIYGVDANGNDFVSEKAAQQYWTDKGYKTDIIKKFGVRDTTNTPFQNEEEALKYWGDRGFDKEMLATYGINPMTSKPFTTEFEANKITNDLELERLKKQSGLEGTKIGDSINSLDEYEFYMNNEKTYDQHTADIIEYTADLEVWQDRLPDLEKMMRKYDADYNYANSVPGDWFSGRNETLINDYELKRDALLEVINSIKAGEIPVISDSQVLSQLEANEAGEDYVAPAGAPSGLDNIVKFMTPDVVLKALPGA